MQIFFPVLKSSGYTITSPPTIDYNCIAWAAGDTQSWWWPDTFNQYYWPPGIPREETIDVFVKAFEFLGYTICPDANHESGYEKVAIYAKQYGNPTHAARQIDTGKWSSKIGRLEDIEHDIDSLNGSIYGNPQVYLKRPKE